MSRPRREPTRLEKFGATPARLAVVGVLAVVLGVVLVPQMLPERSDDSAVQPQSQATGPLQSTEVTTAQSASHLPSRRAVKSGWPTIPLQVAIEHNPFARPSWLEVPVRETSRGAVAAQVVEVDNRAERLAALRVIGTAMVMMVSGEPVAQLDNRTLRVGDIYEGFVVADITPRGVVLSEHMPTPSIGESTNEHGL